MESVNVLVTTKIGEECLERITATSPRVKLRDISDLMRAEWRGDTTAREQLDVLLAEAEIIYASRLPQRLLTRAPGLQWVQVMYAGVDRLLDSEFRRSPVILTNVSGLHATPIGEFVLEMMLMFAKRAPLCFELKQKKQWQGFWPSVLRGKTVGILGLGSIGKEVARLSKAFGMRVIATRRSARRAGRARNVDLVLPPEQLGQLLSDSDFVAITLPYTAETDKLIGEAELRAMKSTAYIINIGRGRIIDEEVLIRALSENWIAGAGLDVFATEPLPAESKLWELPNVIFSPHVSGGMEDYIMQAVELFCKNLSRYLDGKKLFNIVNKKLGY